MTKIHSHKLKKLAVKFLEHCFVAVLLSIGYLIHLLLETKRNWKNLSFHQVIMNDSDFHEDEISLLKFIWLLCNLVPLNGYYVSVNPVKRGLYIVNGRINRISFESNFINQVKSEEL
ncbi:putative membrane protein [Vibrio phage vB_VchM_Kuja]|uniref:Putative membrane protein n=1 Tax=Vibrio phage vB_VchM_Kuja TaxID=2686437 RepID=A0A6B9JAS2_9CAUD|nr:hypothetical protein HWC83_gp161 [Vibrio phage vB_VchM_Kuja]QGZ16066.1 putative membrane protein [Vibrio phage vB_VchM_Kuja]